MLMANVRPGGRVLVVESTGGLVVGACLERMGGMSFLPAYSSHKPPGCKANAHQWGTTGEGDILVINDADSPPDLHLLESFNYSAETVDHVSAIHWAATEEFYIPPDLPMELEEEGEGTGSGEKKSKGKSKILRELNKLKRRKAVFDKTKKARDDFFEGGYDGYAFGVHSFVRSWFQS